MNFENTSFFSNKMNNFSIINSPFWLHELLVSLDWFTTNAYFLHLILKNRLIEKLIG